MPSGQHIPLGTPIPNSPHAVSVSIPTMTDVIGYEEGKAETLDKIKTGYPRFVIHQNLRKIEAHWQTLFDFPSSRIWLTSSDAIAKKLQQHLGEPTTKYLSHGGINGLRLPTNEDTNRQAKLFLQHVGGLLSSREAENYLIAQGIEEPAATSETLFQGDSENFLKTTLSSDLGGNSPDAILLANSGMNSFYASYQAINEVQKSKGRKSWIKLGWLYTDTMKILEKLKPEGAKNFNHYDIFDLDSLEAELKKRPNEFAGIVTETPTNPLVQTIDLQRVRKLADKYGIYLLVDPTMNSIANVDVSPYADIIVTSLTKYIAYEGDTIAGLVCVTDRCPERKTIIKQVDKYLEPIYSKDLQRLAHQAQDYHNFITTINENTRKIVELLEANPKIDNIYWAHQKNSKNNYTALSRSPDSVGSMISFTIKGDLPTFLDNLALPKGPSFGMKSSLACPFIYLAHYEFIQTQEGREYLNAAGISPELIRLSVGAEPLETIIEAISNALELI